MLAKKLSASNAGNGDDGGFNDHSLGIISVMLDTAKRMAPNGSGPHSYLAWAVPTTERVDLSFQMDSFQAHLWLLKQQDEIADQRNGWRLEEFEEIVNLYKDGAHPPVAEFNYLSKVIGIAPDVEVPDFKKAFDAFLEYKGIQDFAAWRDEVKVHSPLVRLPIDYGPTVTVFNPDN